MSEKQIMTPEECAAIRANAQCVHDIALDVLRATVAIDALRADNDRLDKALDKALGQRDAWEEFVGNTAAALGCELEWSNLHDHRNCIDESIGALCARVEKAEAQLAAIDSIPETAWEDGSAVTWIAKIRSGQPLDGMPTQNAREEEFIARLRRRHA